MKKNRLNNYLISLSKSSFDTHIDLKLYTKCPLGCTTKASDHRPLCDD